MSEVLGNWLTSSSAQLIFLIPVFAFLEACVGAGLFVSGVFLLSSFTLLYAQIARTSGISDSFVCSVKQQ